jgi:SAM-dependent methyltransferase
MPSRTVPPAAARSHALADPSPWVARWLGAVKAQGRILDVACGGGRHLRLARTAGHAVTGIDRDLSALADLAGTPGVTLIAADLEDGRPFPLAGAAFDGVIVTNYLWRPILSDIVAAVAPGGVLLYETFALGHERLGRPTNPAFLLDVNELLVEAMPRLAVIAFEHVRVRGAKGRIVQRMLAVGREHPFVRDPPAVD